MSLRIYLQIHLFLTSCRISEVSDETRRKTMTYRVFYNVLRDYKNLLQENRRTRIYETCTDKRNNSKKFPNKLFFIVVHISAARRCECM